MAKIRYIGGHCREISIESFKQVGVDNDGVVLFSGDVATVSQEAADWLLKNETISWELFVDEPVQDEVPEEVPAIDQSEISEFDEPHKVQPAKASAAKKRR